jgi:signal transduction histidine kinase
MASEPIQQRPVFISTLPAGLKERRLAVTIVVISAVLFAGLVPFAKLQLPAVWPFIPAYQSALVVGDLITAVLLFGQYRILRTPALFVLGSGYLFTALIAVVHALTFPGLFSPTGLLGAGPQTTAWLYMFWHGVFPLFVIAYAISKGTAGATGHKYRPIGLGIAVAFLTTAVFGVLATAGQGLLPSIMQGNRYTPLMIGVVSSVWLLSLAALAVLWRRRPHSVLDLWLLVVMCAWLFDIALAAVLNGGRFDLGFYAGRIYGLFAATFVLAMLLIEYSRLYARLVEMHESERERATILVGTNRELEAFSYSVSHDLRTPLRAIDGYAKILEEDFAHALDAEGRRVLGVIAENSKRMGHLIDDLLRFSRLGRQPLNMRSITLDALVREVIDELQSDYAGRTIDFRVAPVGNVNADPSLLKQALSNLVCNAIKFTRREPRAIIEFGCIEHGNNKTYYVKDNGAGFDMRYQDKLFGVFQRLHSAEEFEGTGVGLAIVYRVVQRHGGRVWAESAPNAGATFYFTLAQPVAEPKVVGA